MKTLRHQLFLFLKRILPSNAKDLSKKILNKIGFKTQDYARVVCYREIKQWISELPHEQFDVLEISAGFEFEHFKFKSFTPTHYPDFDISKDTLPQKFDLIIADNVWEHLTRPYQATHNVLNHLKPGGYFLLTTPFLIKVHNIPVDCSRWTPLGMQHFLAECGFPFDAIRVGAWGNRKAVVANFDHFVWGGWRSLKNEPDFPVTVWALARKQS